MSKDQTTDQVLEFPGLSSIAEEENAELAQHQEGVIESAAGEAAQAEKALAGEYLEAVNHAGEIVCSMFPSAEPVWIMERKTKLAEALAKCDATYGWGGVGALIGNPLVGLAFAGFPLVVGTAKAVAKDRAEAAARAAGAPGPGALAPKFSADPMGAAASPAPAPAAAGAQ